MSDWNQHTRSTKFQSHSGAQCTSSKPGPIGIGKFEIDVTLRSDQFSAIRKRSVQLYEMAMKAGEELNQQKSFQKTFAKVQKAMMDVALKLDETGKLTMEFTKPATADDLVTAAVASKLADELKSAMDKSGVFSSLDKLNTILSNAAILLEIRKDIDDRDLVNEQWGKRRKEATRKKIKFVLAAIAADRVGTTQTTRYTDVYIKLWKDYKRYESTWANWIMFLDLEDKLAGTYRVDPEQKLNVAPNFRRFRIYKGKVISIPRI